MQAEQQPNPDPAGPPDKAPLTPDGPIDEPPDTGQSDAPVEEPPSGRGPTREPPAGPDDTEAPVQDPRLPGQPRRKHVD